MFIEVKYFDGRAVANLKAFFVSDRAHGHERYSMLSLVMRSVMILAPSAGSIGAIEVGPPHSLKLGGPCQPLPIALPTKQKR